MTRKDYVALAAALRAARPPVIPGTNVITSEIARKVWYDCCTEVASVCAEGNPRFEASRFFDGCGVPN